MTAYQTTSATHPPRWLRVLLGIVLILAGVFVLSDVTLATIISTKLIGYTAIVAGAFEIVHAFWTKGWGGFVWQILLGALYLAFGWMVVSQPISGALILTFFLGLLLLTSGIVRVFLGLKQGQSLGWIMVLSGAFGFLAGLIILTGWPVSSLWVLGLLLGIDLISHGAAWLSFSGEPALQTG